MISVQNLTKRYDRNVAVNDISFEVAKGQIVGFLGPNGAGKTTTMRILTCFMPPTAGRASVAGFDVLDQPLEVKRRIGYLPETPPLYPEMEVHEYLAFVARLKGIPHADVSRRVAEVSERCAVTDVSRKLISKLSKGYRQRVGLAQAILHNPDVLILDEPTAGLDPIGAAAFDQLLLTLRDAFNLTVFMVTHDLDTLYTTCDRVAVLSQKKVLVVDTLEVVAATPDAWIQEYFHGPRGRAALLAAQSPSPP